MLISKVFNTDIATLGVWSSDEIVIIDSEEKAVALMNQLVCVVWNTKLDGAFLVEVRLEEFSEIERQNIQYKSLGNLLKVKGNKIIAGSPEESGQTEEIQLITEYCLVDVYALLDIKNGKNFLKYVVILKPTVENARTEPITKMPVLEYYIQKPIDAARIARCLNPSLLLDFVKQLTVPKLPENWETVTYKITTTGTTSSVTGNYTIIGDTQSITIEITDLISLVFSRLHETFKVNQNWTSAVWTLKKPNLLKFDVS